MASLSENLVSNPLPPARIFLVDAHPYSRLATVDILHQEHYEVGEWNGVSDILTEVSQQQPDLVLMEIRLPHHNGLDLCQQLKQTQSTVNIPVLLMTSSDDTAQRRQSRQVGADAYLLKPLDRVELLTRIDLLIQKKRLAEWVDQIEEVLFRVAQAIEERYSDRASCHSLGQLAQAFGQYLQLPPTAIQDLVFAARLHDLGTVQIPEAILLKPGQLTEAERELIQQHVLVGAKIFQPLAFRRDVGQIMRHHHEKWDGSGYPDGLQGEAIPFLAQIFQILDIYLALTSPRPYKTAVSPAEALAILQEEANQGWRNPSLVQTFTAFIQQDLGSH